MVCALLDTELWAAYTDNFMPVAHVETVRTITVSAVQLVTSFMVTECQAEEASGRALNAEVVRSLCNSIMDTFSMEKGFKGRKTR